MSAVYIPEPLAAPELWYPKRNPLLNVKINRNAPAAQGLISALLFNEYGGLPRNILSGLEVEEFGASGDWLSEGYYIPASGGLQMNNPKPAISADDGYLWHMDVIFHSGGTNSVIMGNRYDSANFFKITVSAVEYKSSTNFKIDHPANLIAGKKYSITVFKNSSVLEVYFNGVFHASLGGVTSMTSTPVYLGAGEKTEAPRESTEITVLSVFHGYFNGDAGSFNRNPYQILEAA